jgi:hypothetical protein
MTTELVAKNKKKIFVRTRLVPAIVLLATALITYLLFGLHLQPGLKTSFGSPPSGIRM